MITRATQGSCSLEADERSRLAEAADGDPPYDITSSFTSTCTPTYICKNFHHLRRNATGKVWSWKRRTEHVELRAESLPGLTPSLIKCIFLRRRHQLATPTEQGFSEACCRYLQPQVCSAPTAMAKRSHGRKLHCNGQSLFTSDSVLPGTLDQPQSDGSFWGNTLLHLLHIARTMIML